MRSVQLSLVLVGLVACGGQAETDPPLTQSETELSCSDVACEQDMAAVQFVNSAGAPRTVAIDGEVHCELEPGSECLVLVEPAVEIVVHVTAADESSPCNGDPRATLGVCACATFEILC